MSKPKIKRFTVTYVDKSTGATHRDTIVAADFDRAVQLLHSHLGTSEEKSKIAIASVKEGAPSGVSSSPSHAYHPLAVLCMVLGALPAGVCIILFFNESKSFAFITGLALLGSSLGLFIAAVIINLLHRAVQLLRCIVDRQSLMEQQ